MNDTHSAERFQPRERVVAIDVHRGFLLLMFCVVEAFVPVLRTLPATPVRDFLVKQFSHSQWAGCTLMDLGFPTFIMLLAMSMPLSFARRRAAGAATATLVRHVVVRSLLLYAFGTFFHGGLSVPLSEVRFTRVFHRLAIAILISGLAELFLRTRGKIIALIVVLLGYWGLMELFPVPGYGAGDDSPQGNLNYYVDFTLLGAETYFILSTLGVFGTCLCGLLAGHVLLMPGPWQRRAMILAGSGLMLINVGMAWDALCPINKHIWSPSFVAMSSGWFTLVFAGIYAIADGWGRQGRVLQNDHSRRESITTLASPPVQTWAYPLAVLGRHPLFTFAAFGLLPFDRWAEQLAGQGLTPLLGPLQPFVEAAVQVLLVWLLVFWLDRRS